MGMRAVTKHPHLDFYKPVTGCGVEATARVEPYSGVQTTTAKVSKQQRCRVGEG